MALSFLSRKARKRDQIVAIDLGARMTKAVLVQNPNGEGYRLTQFSVLEAPLYEKAPSRELLTEHLKKVSQDLGNHPKQVVLVLGAADSLLRQAEMPLVPVEDMRLMLKLNSKAYLQQELPDYYFDCFILPPKAGGPPSDPGKAVQKCRTIVGGAKKQLVDDLQAAAKGAGLVALEIVPNLIGAVNALELAQPEAFNKEVLAVVDLGYKLSTITILEAGELKLNRVVEIGGDRITANMAETMSISYAEAESLKVGAPQETESILVPLIMPLGRELRASIDFFEHQQDKTVSQVFVSGGAARSDFFIQALQSELMVPCKSWTPTSFMQLALPAQKMIEIDQMASSLTVAIGAAVAAF